MLTFVRVSSRLIHYRHINIVTQSYRDYDPQNDYSSDRAQPIPKEQGRVYLFIIKELKLKMS